MNDGIVIALIASIPGILALIAQAISEYRKSKTAEKEVSIKDDISAIEGAGIVTDKAVMLMNTLNNELCRLKAEQEGMRDEIHKQRIEILDLQKRLKRQEDTLHEWKRGIQLLLDQLISIGLTPVWTPDLNVKLDGE